MNFRTWNKYFFKRTKTLNILLGMRLLTSLKRHLAYAFISNAFNKIEMEEFIKKINNFLNQNDQNLEFFWTENWWYLCHLIMKMVIKVYQRDWDRRIFSITGNNSKNSKKLQIKIYLILEIRCEIYIGKDDQKLERCC